MATTPESPKSEEAGQPKHRRKLGEILIETGLLSHVQLERALEECRSTGKHLGEVLVDLAIVSEDDLTRSLSNQLGFIFVDLAKEHLNPDLSLAVPEPLAKRHQAVPLRLDTIGLSEKDYAAIESFTHRQKGIILVTGPTGSGKTTTLYALLNTIKSSLLNLITVEDPIETSIEGINQTQIHPDAGLTFASALRAILRQDPDVILVGEIRDLETAEIAIRAAMTGHLVLSTLHTNDAPSAITRLINLGVPRYLVASLVEGVVAQRLVRTICQKCKEEATPSQAALMMLKIQPETLANVRFYAGKGCVQCGGTGYWGRVAIMEILDPTARMRELIASEASEQNLRLAALAAKMISLGENGLNKAKAGITTLDELLRVIEISNKIESLCPTCSRIVQYDFQACPFCETLLNRTCEVCRRPLQLEWKLCPYCGVRIEATKSP